MGIDARDGHVMTRGWETATPIEAVELARSVAGCGVERIVYTDIARDGILVGPNIEQTLAVVRAANVHVTASGGVSSLDDIKRLRDAERAACSIVLSLAKLCTKESSNWKSDRVSGSQILKL